MAIINFMQPLIGASFLASFFAGIAALFAPCCITVLLPTYFASIFKQKIKIFLMTFIYFLGLLVVFMPLGLGASFLSQVFSRYHNVIFSLGAIFLIFLGFVLITGRQFSLPEIVHPQLKKYDFVSIFILGIFSGIATTCCAPVLAGVLMLSVLPGSIFFGAAYTLTYVLGMVIPLFIIALLIDKTNLTQKFFIFRKTISYSFLGQKVTITLSSLFSGIMFLGLGVIILFLSQTNKLYSHSVYQVDINIYLTKFIRGIENSTELIPDFVFALFFIGLFLLILKFGIGEIKNLKRKGGGENEI